MNIAPIVLFCFNRPEHLQRTLDALVANTLAGESHITFFCDGPRHEEEKALTDAVRAIAHGVQGFASVTVIEREQNMGCAASVIDGLKYMFARHESLIVMEDDILCSSHTLEFLNEGLQRYQNNPQVFNIAAWSPPTISASKPKSYTYDVYAIPRFNCWGWASWRNRFENIDWDVSDYEEFKHSPKMRKAYNKGGEDLSSMLDAQMDGKINTWDIRVDYARFKKGHVGINPIISYTTNIGMGSGIHCTLHTDKYNNNISLALPVTKIQWLDSSQSEKTILKEYQNFHSYGKVCFIKKLLEALKELVFSILKKLGMYEIIRQYYRKYIKNVL